MSNTLAVDLWNCEYCPICYVHQRHKTLSGEIYNIWSLSENINFFIGALETCRKENLWPVFLSHFAVNVKSYRKCMYIVFILQYQNVQNNWQTLLK